MLDLAIFDVQGRQWARIIPESHVISQITVLKSRY